MTKFYVSNNKFSHDLLKACRVGNLQLVLDFISSEKSHDKLTKDSSTPNQMIIFAAMKGHLDICKAIWDAPHLNVYINNPSTLKNLLGKSFESGKLEVVKFFEEKLKEKNINYNSTISSGLISATKNGHLEVVKHFFLDKSYDDIMHLEFITSSILYAACGHNQLNILHLLLETNGIQEKYNIHKDNDCLFRLACENDSTNITKYLIFDFKIKHTDCIQEHLKLNTHKFGYITKWFELRDSKESLEKELHRNEEQIHTKKLKV